MATQATPLEMPIMSSKKSALHLPPLDPNEPTLPETEAQLRCEGKRRLFRAFRSAGESRWIAEWLLSHPSHPFHHHTSVPADAFDNALAIRGLCRIVTHDQSQAAAAPTAPAPGPISAGHDLLLVPVAHSSGRLIGYTFGGLDAATTGKTQCAFDSYKAPFFPHFVGRFAFDTLNNDLLIVVPRMSEVVTGIISIQRGDGRVRERACFGVLNGSYGYKRLPARIARMTRMSERRLASIPKYQFATGGEEAGSSRRSGEVRTDMRTLRADLAKVERLVKGKFFAPKACKDEMNMQSGELQVRVTGQVESTFDVKDAVGMQVFRDTAGRAYYKYMSSLAKQRAAAAAAGSAGKAGKSK